MDLPAERRLLATATLALPTDVDLGGYESGIHELDKTKCVCVYVLIKVGSTKWS